MLESVIINSPFLISLNNEVFKGCHNLKNVKHPNQLEVLGDDVFFECMSLKSIDIPDSVKEFKGCTFRSSNLNKITFNNNPESITAYAFDLCTNLISVEYKISLKDAIQIGFGVYKKDDNTYSIFLKNKKSFNKQSISDLIIPSEIDGTPVTEIASGGFSELNSIKNVFIADNIKIIGYDAFWKCENLLTVFCSSDLKILKNESFADCSNLTAFRKNSCFEHLGDGCFFNTRISHTKKDLTASKIFKELSNKDINKIFNL